MTTRLSLSNTIDNAALTTTGTFEAALPLLNLKSKLLSKVARTTSPASLSITATWGLSKSIGVVMLCNHNLSLTATVRIAVGADDSGDLAVFPVVAAGNAFVTDSTQRKDLVYWLPDNTSSTNTIITITDTANTDGYVQIGRLFVGASFSPAMGVEYGKAQIGYKSLSEIQTLPNGVKYGYERMPIRTVTLNLTALTENEAFITLFNSIRQNDQLGEVVYSHNGSPTYVTFSSKKALYQDDFSRCFMGTITQTNPLDLVNFNNVDASLTLEEVAL